MRDRRKSGILHLRVIVADRQRGEVSVAVEVLLVRQRIGDHRAVRFLEVDHHVEPVHENVIAEDAREHLVGGDLDLGHDALLRITGAGHGRRGRGSRTGMNGRARTSGWDAGARVRPPGWAERRSRDASLRGGASWLDNLEGGERAGERIGGRERRRRRLRGAGAGAAGAGAAGAGAAGAGAAGAEAGGAGAAEPAIRRRRGRAGR